LVLIVEEKKSKEWRMVGFKRKNTTHIVDTSAKRDLMLELFSGVV